jgi:hypothetical protein
MNPEHVMRLQRWQDAWTSYSGTGRWVTLDRAPTTEELAIAAPRPDGVFLSVDDHPIVAVSPPPHAQVLRVIP